MIGKPEWFTRRKYTGWGFSVKTWQGAVYVAAMVIPPIIFLLLPFWSTPVRTAFVIVWFVIFGLDSIDIMIRLKKDERENLHESITERNVAWFMVIVLTMGLAYEISSNALQGKIYANPFIIVALAGGLIVKLASNIYLARRS